MRLRARGTTADRARLAWLPATWLAALLATLSPDRGRAQDGSPFYAGKQVAIVVGTPPGSPASLYAQLTARHLGRHVPGAPTFIVQHMPGAGGMTAANTAYATMARDGTALVTTNSAILIEPLLGGKAARFEAPRFGWVGGTHVERMTCVTWHTSPVRTLADAQARPAVIGSYGADGPSAVLARAANRLAGTRFTLITGYGGGPEALGAMERGETDGFCAMGWQELTLRHAHWLRDGKVNVLFQMGLSAEPETPGGPAAPLLLDHALSPLDRQAMEVLFTPLEFGRPLYAPPGIPPDRLEVLRAGLGRALADPLLVADALRSGVPVHHVSGAEIERLIAAVYRAPEAVRQRLTETQP